MKRSQRKTTAVISFASLFAAMTTIFIYLIHIPYGTTGYIHFGDAIIYLCASFVPTPYAVLSAVIGAGLADFISGYPIYIIPTMIIKALIALTFTSKGKKFISKRNVIATVISFVISVGLYALTEFFFGIFVYSTPAAGSVALAASTVLQNSIQAVASAAIYLPVSAVLDRFNIKSRFDFH